MGGSGVKAVSVCAPLRAEASLLLEGPRIWTLDSVHKLRV